MKSLILIDDNDIDNYINEKLLSSFTWIEKLTIHESSQAALDDIILKIHSGEPLPYMIMMDIHMPVLDGFQMLDKLCETWPQLGKECNVFLLSNTVDPKDFERAESKPYIKGILGKPLSCNQIEQIIRAAA